MSDSIPLAKVQDVLNRLHNYYMSRSKVSLHAMRDSVDAQSASTHADAAARWEAKGDAVKKVAENLDITLKEIK